MAMMSVVDIAQRGKLTWPLAGERRAKRALGEAESELELAQCRRVISEQLIL